MQSRKKPWKVVRHGSVSVNIYRTGDGFRNVWRDESGVRQFLFRKNSAEAVTEAETTAAKLAKGDVHSTEISDRDARYFMALQKRMDPVPIHVAVDDYLERKSRGEIKDAKTPELIALFLEEMKKDESGVYVQNLGFTLNRFAKKFTGNIGQITSTDIAEWISKIGKASRSRYNARAILITFFKWARDTRRALPREMKVEPELTTKPNVRSNKHADIYTPDEYQKLLNAAWTELAPTVAIGGGAGVRTSEITGQFTDHAGMDWERDILWDEDLIRVGFQKIGTGGSRYVPMHPNLKKTLLELKTTGAIYKGTNVAADFQKLAKLAGVKWKKNGLRKSYITYRMCIVQDAAKVADECNTSPQVIYKRYRRPELKSVALKFLEIVRVHLVNTSSSTP